MKKLSVLGMLILVAMFSFNVKADIITLDGANEIANAFFANSASSQKRALKSAAQLEYAWDSNSLTQTGSSMMKSVDEDPTFYVFNNPDGEGFVIVSGDSNARSVIGYSYEGSVPMADEIPDPMKDYLLGIDEEIKWARENITSTGKNLKATLAETGEEKEVYLPTPSWDQHEPFNAQCYTDATSSNIGITGCVPIAYAMIMKYHNWPEVGTLGYTNEGGRYELANMYTGVAISNRTYDWNKILFSYPDGNYTQEQADEVAKLVSHIGHAFTTDHVKGTSNEGASTKWLNYFFGYNWVDASQQSNFTLEDWKVKIRESLDRGCPIPYAADRSSNSGDLRHMFVLDGYKDIEDVYHFNWGWRGSANGWFSMTAMTSDGRDYSWKDGSDHTAFFNFQPDKTVTVSVAVDGTGSVTIDGASVTSTTVNFGDPITLTATGDNFYGWMVGNDVVSTDNPYTFTATSTKTYTAKFAPSSNLTLMSVLMVDDTPSADDVNTATSSSSKLVEGVNIELTANPQRGYEFLGWFASDGLTKLSGDNPATLTITSEIVADPFIYAEFAQLTPASFTVTTADANMGSASMKINGTAVTEVYAGEQVTLVAEPVTGYVFKNWKLNDAEIVGGSSITVTADNNQNYVAYFVATSELATITVNLNKGGTVSINGGTASSQAKLTNVQVGSNITLQANPVSPNEFLYWVDYNNEKTILSESNPWELQVTGTFRYKAIMGEPLIVTATTNNSGGSATVYPSKVLSGKTTTLTATPAQEYTFTGWSIEGSGDIVSTNNPYEATITANTTYVANFTSGSEPVTPTQYTVTVSTNGTGGTATVNGEQTATVDAGSTVTIVATPAQGYRFVRWKVDGTDSAEIAEWTIEVTEDYDFQAIFEPIQYTVTVSTNGTGGTATVNGEQTATVDAGSTVTIVATPAQGYVFDYWTINGEQNPIVGASEERTVNSDLTLVAYFREEQSTPVEYFTNFGTSTRTTGDRNLNSITLNNQTIQVGQSPSSGAQIYFDKVSEKITLAQGATVVPNIDWVGYKMHGYIYVDWDNDGTFEPSLAANGVPNEGSELIAYTYYNGYDHAGASLSSDNDDPKPSKMKNFTIPATAQLGEYRARYTTMWDTTNANSTADKANGMSVVDFTLEIVEAPETPEDDGAYLSLNGTSQYMRIPHHDDFNISTTESFTVTAKVMATNLAAGDRRFFAKRDYSPSTSNKSGYEIWGANSATQFIALNSPNTSNSHANSLSAWTSGYTATAGTWYHVAFVVDRSANKMYVYVDGTQRAVSTADISAWACTNPFDVYVGALQNGSSVEKYMNGGVDELRFYSTALSANEISTDMNSFVTSSTPNLIAAYNFSNIQGTTVPDISGNGHNGVLEGYATASASAELQKIYYRQYVGRGTTSEEFTKLLLNADGATTATTATISLDGTTSITDVTAVKIYSTATDSTFTASSATLLASLTGTGITTGDITVNLNNAAISQGTNYLWLTCDVAENATEGNAIKATIKNITVGGNQKDLTQLSGTTSRTVMLNFEVVYDLNQDGSKYYRIPALIQAADNSLVAVSDKRFDVLTDLPNSISIVSRRSTDNGKTWSAPVAIASKNDGVGNKYGDAAIMRTKEGNLVAVFVGNNGLGDSNSSNLIRLYQSTSTDNGQSWSAPTDITESIYSQVYDGTRGMGTTRYGMFAGSGHALTTESGRLMFVVAARSTGSVQPLHNFAVYSDNNGQSWTVSTNSATNSSNKGDEAKVVELLNGDILMSIRNPEKGSRKFSLSTDGGATWSSATTRSLSDPACNGDIIRYNYNGRNYLIHSLCGSSSDRTNVTIYLSADEGQTWNVSRQLVNGMSAYSSLEVLNDGSIGCFVEVGKHVDPTDIGMRMTYFNFSFEWLLQGTTEYNVTASANVQDGGTVTQSANKTISNGKVWLTAEANEGYTFTGWTKNGQTLSSDAELYVTVTEATTCVANFESQGGDDDDDDIQYCTPSVTTQGTSTNYVGQIVTLTTTGAVENANWNNPHDTNINGYDPVKNTFSVLPGQTITLNIVDKNTTWGCVRVYVDLNGNKTFDSGEQIFADASRNRTTPISQQFTLSSDIQLGSYLMRVMYVDADATTLTKWACDSYTQGGYYDFYFNVTQPEDCTVSVASNDDTMGTATISETDVQTGQTIILTATPASNDYRFVNWTVGGEVVSTENPYSAIVTGDAEYVANFAVYAVEPKKFDRTGWTVTASSEETVGETAPDDYIIDNSTTTFWHSKWKNGEAGYPHWFMIDMKSVKSINAFDYVSRGTGTTDAGENNGNIKNYTLYVSETEINVNSLPSAATSGTFSYTSGSNVHNVELKTPVIGRYVMLYATGQSANGRVNAACADFQIYGKDVYSVSATATPQTGGTATVTPNKVAEGDVATFTATVNAGYKFLGWFNGDTKVSEDAEYAPRISGNLSLTAKFEEIPAITPVAASTDMVQYQRNHIDLIHDNDLTTKFWSSTAQQVGQYITLELGGLYEVEDIALYFASGDRPGAAKIEISTNGSDWNEVSTFNSSDIPAGEGGSYGCTAEGAEARFVKMTITSPNGDKWLQLLEFKVYGTEVVDVPEYAVSVEPNNQGWGTVSIQGYDDTSISIEEGLTLTLLAEPEDDYLFVNWTVNDAEVSHEATFRTEPIFEATTYVANFKEKTRYNVTANATEGGTAEVSQSSVLPGNQVTFTATPADGYKFVNWTEGGVEVSTENPYTVTITAEKELTANFKAVSTELLLSFAAISDLHAQQDLITNANNIQLRESVTKTLSKIKEEEKNLDLIVLGGDYTSNNAIPYESWEKTRELLINATRGAFNGTKTPVIYVNGNHEYEVANYNNPPRGYNAGEYYGTPMKTDIGALAEEDDCFYEYAENGTGEAFKLLAAYHYVVKGFDFVVLNAGKKLFTSASDYSYSEESVEWCKEKLAEIYADDANKTVFFLVHIPFSDSNRLNEGKGMASNDATTLLKSTLAKYPNLVMLYGHDHGGDSAYIRTSTDERVTEYATDGSVYTGEGSANSLYYIQNYNTSKYLGYNSYNLAPIDTQSSDVTIATSTVTDGAFTFHLTGAPTDTQGTKSYIHCGGSGRFSGNSGNTDTNQQIKVFKVVDPTAATIRATQVTEITSGGTYMLVASNNGTDYYALTDEMYQNNSSGQRMNGAAVTISEGSIEEYTPGTASVLWTINKKPSATDKSFFSSFMGSMRYYNNTIEGTDQLADRNIVQALMVYVYSDRVELKMKNYAQSGTINGITVNQNLTPYVSERTVTHSAEAVTAQPVITSTGGEVNVGDEVTVTVEADEWHNLYYTLDGTEPTEESAKVENGKITFTAQAGNNVIKVAAQEGIRLMSPSVSVTYTATIPLLTVTVSSADENMGSVTASATEVEYEDRVKVTATANDGYYFVKWTDVNDNTISESFSYTFVVTESVELIAHFAPLESGERTIKTAVNDDSKGYVIIGASMDKNPSVTTADPVELSAYTQPGCVFMNWTIDGVVISTNPNYTYTRKKSVTLQANFNSPELQLPSGYPQVGTIMNFDCTTFINESTKNADTHALHSLRAVSSYEGGGKEIELSLSSHTINNYTGSTTINVKQGGTLTINFTVGTYTNNIWFGFDWNRDGKFDEVIAGFEGSKPSGTTQGSISVTIPEDALPGKSVMRIISDGIVCESAWNVTTPMVGTHGEGVVGYAGSLHDITMFVNNVIKSEVNLANIQAQEENVLVTTESPAEIVVGSETYNTTEDNLTATIPVSEGDVKIVVRGSNIVNVDCGNTLPTTHILPVKELVLRNTSAAEVAIDAPLLERITVVSDENNNVAAVSVASDLSQGVQVVVEKTIKTPVTKADGTTPTIFNFLSMPFAFNTSSIKYWDGDSWKSAELENHIRIMLYDFEARANAEYLTNGRGNCWQTLETAQQIEENQGFVIIGNNDLGTTVKLQFTSADKAYDGSVTTVEAQNYGDANTHIFDEDWNFNGVPYLTMAAYPAQYTLYSYDNTNQEWIEDYPIDGVDPLKPYTSVMYQAGIDGEGSINIPINTAMVADLTNSAEDIFARAYISIDDTNPAKIILCDETSENFVVNEDAWYMASLNNSTPAAYFNVAGVSAKVSVQPAASELPMTVYTGAGTQHRITLTATDGNYDVYLKDAATDEVVCLNDEDYNFTATAKTTIANRFTVSMVEPTGIIEAARAEGEIKAVVAGDVIKLYGTEEGGQVTLYTANGMVITNAVAEDGVTTIATSAEGVIIVKVADQTLKVVK